MLQPTSIQKKEWTKWSQQIQKQIKALELNKKNNKTNGKLTDKSGTGCVLWKINQKKNWSMQNHTVSSKTEN